MNKSEIQNIFKSFEGKKVLIVGDVMVDAYIWGKVNRISPEAPVPIVAITKRENRLGGAANVALNIKEMGAIPILCSVIGKGEKGQIFMNLMNEQNLEIAGIVQSEVRVTTVKTRIIGNNHQMLRVDDETLMSLRSEEKENLKSCINSFIDSQKIDVIIFEDYDKGVITPEIIDFIIQKANSKGIPTIVDPKKDNFLKFNGVTVFKPNLKELKEGLKLDFDEQNLDELKSAVTNLKEKLNISISLITLSELGVYVSSSECDEIVPAFKRDIADVSGAGDTVTAIAALCLAVGTSHKTMAWLSNMAGGLVCEEVGVKPVNKEKLLNESLTLLNSYAV